MGLSGGAGADALRRGLLPAAAPDPCAVRLKKETTGPSERMGRLPSVERMQGQSLEEDEDEELDADAASRSRIMCWSVMRIATTNFSYSGR